MESDSGERFDIEIPTFSLDIPTQNVYAELEALILFAPDLSKSARTKPSCREPVTFSNPLDVFTPHKAVILRTCDFFDLWVFFAHPARAFELLHKTVILEAVTFYSRKNGRRRCGRASRRGNCSVPATTLSYLSSRPQGRDLQFSSPATNLSWKRHPPPFILRACDSFDLPVFFAHPIKCFQTLHKTVILSEAPRRSVA